MASVTLDLIDGLASAKAFKGACRVATTANISLSGEQTIDGIAVVEDDRVLVKNQTSSVDNGIYVASTGDWRRAADFGAANDFGAGTLVFVNLGTVGGGYLFRQTAVDPEIDVDDITFSVLTYSATVQVSPTITTPAISGGTITDTIITLEQGASVAPTAEGRIAWDTDDNKLKVGDGSGTKTFSDDSLLQPINADLTAIADTGIVALAGTLWGLTLSNNGTDAANDIDIAAGIAIDSTNAVLMRLASSLTKRLDAAWAVGSGNGGRDTGSIADGTWHVHLIKRPDTGVVDVLFSLSATAPTLPTNYTVFRCIGPILRVSSAIKAFTQIGDYFEWSTPVADIASAAQTTGNTTRTLASIPTGKAVLADIGVNIYRSGGTGQFGIASSPARAGGTVVDRDTAGVGYSTGASAAGSATARMLVLTNTSAQIVTDANQTGEVSITVFGFYDNRGRT